MEQAALSVPTGNPCPGHSEQGRSPFVVGEPTLRRMAPPPSDSGTAMEEVGQAAVHLFVSCENEKEQSLTLILIAPRWPKAPWLAEIIPLLYA